jgi:hypothetical protein
MTANSRTSAKSIILMTVALGLMALMLVGIGLWLQTIILDFRPYWTSISAFVLGYLTHHVMVNGLPSITLGRKVSRVLDPIGHTIGFALGASMLFVLALAAYRFMQPYLTPILWVVGFFTTWFIVGWVSTAWTRKRR